MSKPAVDPNALHTPEIEDPEEPVTGSINLTLVYSLLAVALLSAILFAVFIVYPFWIRR